MKIRFHINYKTWPGQDLYISGSSTALGKNILEQAFPMVYGSNGLWTADIIAGSSDVFTYRYFLRQADGSILRELGAARILDPQLFNTDFLQIVDTWFWPDNFSKPLYTDAFKKTLLKQEHDADDKCLTEQGAVRFQIAVPRLANNYAVGIVGNSDFTGNWNQARFQKLKYHPASNTWYINIPKASVQKELHYKYCVYRKSNGKVQFLEKGEGRKLHHLPSEGNTLIRDQLFYFPLEPWKGAGVAIPVSAVRTPEGFGTGEFEDLKKLTDWAKLTGLKMIQVLPINDTVSTDTVTDSNPYKAISVMALHPMYINIEQIGSFPDTETREAYVNEKAALNLRSTVDYDRVVRRKLHYLKIMYKRHRNAVWDSVEYQAFEKENKTWLHAYAVFSCLRSRNGTADFNQWPEKYSNSLLNEYCDKDTSKGDEARFYCFIQYFLHKQLSEAAAYARKNGVVLKGDIPIGIHPESDDTWSQPELFKHDVQAGAPPDDFSDIGQNWELPTYNWEIMAENNYRWWQERLQHMARYFDAFRFDHILGFFRIWEIPKTAVQGVLGYFNPALPLSSEEIKTQNIPFSEKRYTEPYITENILKKYFKGDLESIKKKYFEPEEKHLRFKKKYDNQRKVTNAFKKLKRAPKELLEKLLTLHANVLFIKSDKPDKWHPRVQLHETDSFKALDKTVQRQLHDLHNHFFYDMHNDFWHRQALQKLPALMRSTNMLVCGEDLGMVPDCVSPVMESRGILSLEIERMPKQTGLNFGDVRTAPYLSVCTTSSHDTTGIRSWWENEIKHKEIYFRDVLHKKGKAPAKASAELCRAIVENHFQSPAMWVCLPVQDLFAINEKIRLKNPDDERINIPGTADHPWVYRIHTDLDDLLKADEFNAQIKTLVRESKRDTEF